MNLCGSSGGGGTAHEVELDQRLLVGIEFHGAIVVYLRLGFCKHRKRERERAERATKIRVGREMKSLCGFLKESKFSLATQQRRALRCYEAWVRSGVGLYTTAYPKCDKGYASG